MRRYMHCTNRTCFFAVCLYLRMVKNIKKSVDVWDDFFIPKPASVTRWCFPIVWAVWGKNHTEAHTYTGANKPGNSDDTTSSPLRNLSLVSFRGGRARLINPKKDYKTGTSSYTPGSVCTATHSAQWRMVDHLNAFVKPFSHRAGRHSHSYRAVAYGWPLKCPCQAIQP